MIVLLVFTTEIICSKQTSYTGPPALKPVDLTKKKLFLCNLVTSLTVLPSGTVVKTQTCQMNYKQSLLKAH